MCGSDVGRWRGRLYVEGSGRARGPARWPTRGILADDDESGGRGPARGLARGPTARPTSGPTALPARGPGSRPARGRRRLPEGHVDRVERVRLETDVLEGVGHVRVAGVEPADVERDPPLARAQALEQVAQGEVGHVRTGRQAQRHGDVVGTVGEPARVVEHEQPDGAVGEVLVDPLLDVPQDDGAHLGGDAKAARQAEQAQDDRLGRLDVAERRPGGGDWAARGRIGLGVEAFLGRARRERPMECEVHRRSTVKSLP